MSGSKFRRRVSPEEIAVIVELRAAGVHQAEVARRLGVSPATVTKYTRGDVYVRTEPPRPPSKDDLLLAAYPWAHTLTTVEREQFATELAHPPRFAKEMDITRMIWRWRVKAERRTA